MQDPEVLNKVVISLVLLVNLVSKTFLVTCELRRACKLFRFTATVSLLALTLLFWLSFTSSARSLTVYKIYYPNILYMGKERNEALIL